MHALMAAHPLGLLVTNGADGLQANSIPFMVDAAPAPNGTLIAHVARANPLWREAAGTPVLVVFQGPQAYISPAWYATKRETGKVVPTWNYVLVEARGRLIVRDDAAWVHALVSTLTDLHEAARPVPWKVSDAPADYIEATQRAIVGIEVELSSLKGKWKVSQNRSAADRAGVVQGLTAIGREDAATLIDTHGPHGSTPTS
jgi:transcriptional regulator